MGCNCDSFARRGLKPRVPHATLCTCRPLDRSDHIARSRSVTRSFSSPRRIHHAASRHALHRPVGRPAVRNHVRKGRSVRLRRPRARLLGRPLRRRRGQQERQVRQAAVGDPQGPRPDVVRDLQPPRRPGGVRQHRRAARRDPARRHLRRRRAGGRPQARRPADDRHRQGRPEVHGRQAREEELGRQARRRQRLHRLVDLALDLRLPPHQPGLLAEGLRRLRQAVESRSSTPSTRSTSTSASRCTPPRSPSTSPPPSGRVEGGQATQTLRLQLRPLAPRLPGRGLREVHPHLRQAASTTCT